MKQSLFSSDIKEAEILEKVLDKEIYPYIFKTFDRKTDLKSQKLGIDIVCNNVNVDEKAQIKYKNSPLPTQAFEVNFLSNRGSQEKLGWFLNNDLETQVYAIISIVKADVKSQKEPIKKVEQIEELEILYVPKKKLQRMILEKIDRDTIFSTAKKMRKKELPKSTTINSIKFVYTDFLAEKPVNIVVHKKDLPISKKIIWKKDKGVEVFKKY